jgi:hypothetical protein
MKIHPALENANPSESIHDPLDAIVAAPKNHKVLYENDHVRILEVTVQPGEIENMHHHPCASVFAHDAPMPKFTNSFADDGSVMELGRNLQLISASCARLNEVHRKHHEQARRCVRGISPAARYTTYLSPLGDFVEVVFFPRL